MEHTPVLLRECIDGLNIKPDGVYIDGTLGRGGHAREITARLSSGRLIAIDRDADAITEAKELLSGLGCKITFVHGNFKDISAILESHKIEAADGMLFDLGVSSPQLDDTMRGFSYSGDARLDMRMDRQDGLSAHEIVNSWPEDKLRQIFFDYGEERYARQIARAIVGKRGEKPIDTTNELSDAIISAVPAAARRESQHPAKRCFQAIRIAVNDELGSIAQMLASAPAKLKPGGRLCVISFHSLEDRLVKNAFNDFAKSCVCPKDFPVCVCNASQDLRVVTKRPITPSKDELDNNPRARSAKLRIAEKV